MTYSLLLVQIWREQFRRLPPDINELSNYPLEARVAWKQLMKQATRGYTNYR
jgi:hypothetical protein